LKRLSKTPVSDTCFHVAFTPKGGCPLKLQFVLHNLPPYWKSSIHPQGWVPIETSEIEAISNQLEVLSSIHPQGWVPIETLKQRGSCSIPVASSIHPQGWVPIETCVCP